MKNDYQKAIANLKEERKADIIGQATLLFIEKGIYEVSMGDVAAHCNVGTASLYRYYGTKNGLVIKCAESIWEHLCDYLNTCSSRILSQNGREETLESMKLLLSLYKDKEKELCFIQTFDTFVSKQHIEKEALIEYEAKVELFYSFFKQFYQKGLADGSIAQKENGLFEYLAIIHTLFCMSQKFANGVITSHDDETRSIFELQTIISLYERTL